MAKKVVKNPARKTVHVREMPVELWDKRLADYVERTRDKKYAVVEKALRQFLDKEEEK